MNKFGNIIDEFDKKADFNYFNDENNVPLKASTPILENGADFASLFSETKKVSRKEMAIEITNNGYVACTVGFHKKAEDKAIKQAFYNCYPNKGKIISEVDYKASVDKLVKTALDGDERTLVGYYLGKSDTEGRLLFFDSEVFYKSFEEFPEKDTNFHKSKSIRLVDPRTIYLLILKNVQYLLKK